jgi:hypothetical protein
MFSTLALVVLAGGILRASVDDRPAVTSGPSPTEPVPVNPAGLQRTIGNVAGVTVEVSPSTGLVNGQTISVKIDGLGELAGAQLGMCRGDVQNLLDFSACDQSALGALGPDGTLQATPDQELVVSSYLRLDSAEGKVTYDCAAEPAGCVLAVATAPPVRGVVVPVSFASSAGRSEPAVRVSPGSDLTDGALVTVTASGLRPNRTYGISQCVAGELCNQPASATTDSSGTLTSVLPAQTSILSVSSGVVDCTAVSCVVTVHLNGVDPIESAPLSFAPGVHPTAPSLKITPAGPYRDRQIVTVEGVGFPAGENVGSHLGRCPAELDTRTEERCTYDLGEDVVAPDGTFRTTYDLRACYGGAGCVLGWVITNGPTVASVPLEFIQ